MRTLIFPQKSKPTVYSVCSRFCPKRKGEGWRLSITVRLRR